MKKTALFIAALVAAFSLTACGEKPTGAQKIQENVTENVHALTADERPRAKANAVSFFESEFPVQKGDKLTKERGSFLECRLSDSNFNGLVTCRGLVPQLEGGFREITRYCGYTPELVGCSDQDTNNVASK